MKRFMLLVCVMFMHGPVFGQEKEILINDPPVYTEGEHADGVLTGPEGEKYTISQRVERTEDGTIYILHEIKNDTGVIARSLFDPKTWIGHAVGDGGVMSTLSSTCSEDGLYPIFVGKVYECSQIVEADGRRTEVRSRMEFTWGYSDTQGNVTSVCAFSEDTDEVTVTHGRICMSADGKWIESLEILKVIPRSSESTI